MLSSPATIAHHPDVTSTAEASTALKWWLAILVFSVAFFGIEHDLRYSESVILTSESEIELGDLVESGNPIRKASYLLLAALGAALLLAPAPRRLVIKAPLVFMACFGAVCVASLAWTDDVPITLRRLPILFIWFITVIGVARQFSPREVCWLILGVCGAHLAVGVFAELAMGNLRPHLPDYRFAGTLHPNTQGISCSLLALAGLALWREHSSRRWLLCLVVIAAVTFLLLTKSRTSCAGFAAAIGCYLGLRCSPRIQAQIAVWVPFLVVATALICLLDQNGVGGQLRSTALMGRSEEAGTLTGRLPLWQELADYIQERPLLGYGYGAFWNVARVRAISDSQGWQIGHAHSGYVEMVVNVGFLGAATLGAAIFSGACLAWYRYMSTRDVACTFVLAQIVFALVCSLADAYYVIPSFCATVCACSLASLAMMPAAHPPPSSQAGGPS